MFDTEWWRYPVAAFFILYWPIMGALIFLGKRLEKRYPPSSVQRERANLALGCAVLAMPGVPAIVAVGSILVRNPTDPTVLLIEAIIAFNLVLALLFGGLRLFAKFRGRVGSQ